MHGEIAVTGEGETRIELLGRPDNVNVRFEAIEIVPCNHHHHGHEHDHDRLEYYIAHEDENPHHHHDPGHRHHNRKFLLVIKWEVFGVRVIHWSVSY